MTTRPIIALFIVSLTLCPSLLAAQNGAFEINQVCVEAGCFPGDSPGFPVDITVSGVYNLTSNLNLPSPEDTAIRILEDDVVLDLKSFTIDAGNRCTGAQGDCSNQSSAGVGVGSDRTNVSVRNGVIKGFGWKGVNLGGAFANIDSIQAQHNFRAGIGVNDGATVRDSSASSGGQLGIEAGASRLLRVTAINNGQFAIAATGAHIDEALVLDNEGIGLFVSRSLISNSVVARNGTGIWSTAGGNRIFDSQISENEGLGIFLQPAIPPGLPSGETLTNSFSGLSLYENNGGNDNPQIGGSGGLWESLGQNLCARDTTC